MAASWKKVVVSGSSAELASLKVDNLINGVVTGSSNGTLSTVPINGTGNIVATTGASGVSMTGSFTGSFTGAFIGTSSWATYAVTASYVTGSVHTSTNPALSASYAVTSSYSLLAQSVLGTITNASTASYVLPLTQSVIVSGALLVTGSVSATQGGFTGSLFGTASYVTGSIFGSSNPALSASYALTASYAANGGVTTVAGTANEILVNGGTTAVAGAITISLPSIVDLGAASSFTSTALTGSLLGTASYVTGSVFTSANPALSASYALTASYAANGGTLLYSVTPGLGLSGSAFNGSSAQTFYISGAAQLTNNYIPKWVNNTGFNNSNIQDNGTLITLGSTAIGVSIPGNLTVAGTASFTNIDSLFVADKFILLASGSPGPGLTDGGIIVAGPNGLSGSAWYLETTNTGNYGRWATSINLNATSSDGVVSEYAVTVNVAASANPSAAPVWGGSTSGSGNMWINNNTGDIFIYA